MHDEPDLGVARVASAEKYLALGTGRAGVRPLRKSDKGRAAAAVTSLHHIFLFPEDCS